MAGPSSVIASSDLSCAICLCDINSQATCKGEEKKALDNCSHIFHKECIGEWLKQKHSCPLCRAHVDVDTPEAKRPEMTAEEIFAVPDSEILTLVRNNVAEIRRIRRISLSENTPVANSAKKVHSIANSIFGWN